MSKHKSKPPKQKRQYNDGKLFEKLNFLIQLAKNDSPNAIVYFDHKLKSKTGGQRQFDVVIEIKYDDFVFLVGIECKDHNSANVPVEKLDAFETKCNLCGIDRKIMVAAKGFQKEAINNAKIFNIQLFTLSEISQEETKQWFDANNLMLIAYDGEFHNADIVVQDTSIFKENRDINLQEYKIFTEEAECESEELINYIYHAIFPRVMEDFKEFFRNEARKNGFGMIEGTMYQEVFVKNEKNMYLKDSEGRQSPIIQIDFYIKTWTHMQKPINLSIKEFNKLKENDGLLVVNHTIQNYGTFAGIKKKDDDFFDFYFTPLEGIATKLTRESFKR
ncbi:restriction endonuclease [Emticicia fluvialis]|uniref:restriction endonuclease n=1 Tax=Emticicia fluvialis TaxID=2974474 RepID=UPI0021652EBE|nr:restriction endonuclease [Emticicia fluvialis]